jgi:hypothetical protein
VLEWAEFEFGSDSAFFIIKLEAWIYHVNMMLDGLERNLVGTPLAYRIYYNIYYIMLIR